MILKVNFALSNNGAWGQMAKKKKKKKKNSDPRDWWPSWTQKKIQYSIDWKRGGTFQILVLTLISQAAVIKSINSSD